MATIIYKNEISEPMAEDKFSNVLMTLTRKLAKNKQIKRGVKEVVKSIRRGAKGLCIIAGDISPIDVISHIPVYCEDKEIPYIYVPTKEMIGIACMTKRPTSVVLLCPTDDSKYLAKYKKIVENVKKLNPYL